MASILGVFALAGTAQAALPGANGKIAFKSTSDGDYEIYTVDSAGAGLLQLTSNPATDGDPAWSPDGTQIAFVHEPRRQLRDLQDERGRHRPDAPHHNAGADVEPSWSPDGTQIAFASDRDGNFEIYKMNADGTGQTRLTNNAVGDEYPAWSPDGTKIAYQSDRTEHRDLHDEHRAAGHR